MEPEIFCYHCGACTHTDCVLAEREACAKIAEEHMLAPGDQRLLAVAEAIRARAALRS